MKKALIVFGGLLLSFALHGCGISTQAIQYKGQERQVAEVEEMLSDLLESENPDLDFNIQITEESDSD